MTQFEVGSKVRINEGLLEGKGGTVTESDDYLTRVSMDETIYVKGDLTFFTETLVDGSEPPEALAHLKRLYPDFLTSDRYLFRLTTFVGGIMYQTAVPMPANLLVLALATPPAGLHAVEFMQKNEDPNRGLAWKTLWSE